MTDLKLPGLEPIRAEMCKLIRAALATGRKVSFCRTEADGSWEVTIAPDGTLSFDGYAADVYQPTTSLESLDFADLAYLTENAAAALAA